MSELKFNKSHEWVKASDGNALIGISDHAQAELGDIVFIELPESGIKLEASAQFGTVESTKAASELYTPVGGEVVEVNDELVNNPQWINESPQDKGWMIKIKLEDPAQIDSLMDSAAYQEFIEKEAGE